MIRGVPEQASVFTHTEGCFRTVALFKLFSRVLGDLVGSISSGIQIHSTSVGGKASLPGACLDLRPFIHHQTCETLWQVARAPDFGWSSSDAATWTSCIAASIALQHKSQLRNLYNILDAVATEIPLIPP